MVDKVWKESMVDAKRIGDKILAIKLMRAQEKFWEDLEGLVQGIPQQKIIFLCEDLNGHVGSQKRHFTNAHGFGDLNEKGQTIFYFSMAFDLLLYPSCFWMKQFRTVFHHIICEKVFERFQKSHTHCSISSSSVFHLFQDSM